MSRRFHILVAAALLAFAPAVLADAEYYLVDSIAEQTYYAPARAQARVLRHIYEDLSVVSGVEAELVWSTDPDINAYATEVDGEKIVVVNEGLLAMMGRDRDAVAATIGHELAHHKADHITEGRRKQEGVRVFGAILGAVVGAKVGSNSSELAGAASAAAVGFGAHLIALKFNRNQELEADRLAIEWMIAAGYNPNGMIRLQEQLGAMTGGRKRAGILSTHPTSTKRYAAAEKHIAKLGPSGELLARPQAPLVGDDALAEATAAVESAQPEAVAAAPAVSADARPSGAALAPDAADSNVHVGDNVNVGSNVRIGGKPVATGSKAD
jgi:predicted Zn-dependent protease